MPKYRVIVYCSDCTGEDPQGCFDGGSEILYYDPTDPDGYTWDGSEYFPTKELADEAGFQITRECGPWQWDVEEVS